MPERIQMREGKRRGSDDLFKRLFNWFNLHLSSSSSSSGGAVSSAQGSDSDNDEEEGVEVKKEQEGTDGDRKTVKTY